MTQGDIQRLRGQRSRNYRKMKRASSENERKHFRMLVRKNEEQIEKYQSA